MPLFGRFWKKEDDESSGDEVTDQSAGDLSYVGTALYDVLRRRHNHHHHELWNVTKGKMIGKIHMTPKDAFSREDSVDPPEDHDDWFPEKCGEILSRTEQWCDVMSLAPPDGRFMEEFKKALLTICKNREASLGRVTIRMMFGNIVGMPVNCTTLIRELTKDLPFDATSKIKLWVGSWRKGISWNHAKIIAVDGKYLWTGGHNFWDKHYLRNDPVNDLSLEMEGGVARDAHRFANAQWGYVVKKQSTAWGRFVDRNLPDALDVPRRARVTVSDYPEDSTAEFPPYYKDKKQLVGRRPMAPDPDYVPVITMGRYGKILKKSRPSDDGIVAMMDAAQTIIRLALQDLGPVSIPGTKMPLPGMNWPEAYLNALARALWTKGVDVEIVLSNPGSIPGDCSPTEACYGNGWSCVDVASEIIKAVQKLFPDADDADLRQKVEENLRVCFLKSPRGGQHYKDGQTLGLHCKSFSLITEVVVVVVVVGSFLRALSLLLIPKYFVFPTTAKHFIVDDICCYIGSQNLYICDLAEWGVVIDHPEKVQSIKEQYWDPMWNVSYLQDDWDVQAVMDGLKIDRTAKTKTELTKIQMQQMKEKVRATALIPAESKFHAKKKEDDDVDNDELLKAEEVSDAED